LDEIAARCDVEDRIEDYAEAAQALLLALSVCEGSA
jgi:hypothetical protein